MMIRSLRFTHKKPIGDRFLPLLFFFAAGAAEAQTLTAEDAARLALERPENATVLGATVDAAHGDLVDVQTLRNPVFAYAREGGDGFGGDGTENFYRLERSFDLSGRRSLARRAAGARLAAARHGLIDARARLRAEAFSRFYDVLAAEAKQAAVRSYAGHLGDLESAIAARERAGDASKYDLGRVRQETLRASAMQARTGAEAFAARQAIAALIGRERVVGTSFTDDLLPPPAPAAPALVARAETAPRLSALAAKAEASRYEKEAAGRVMPEITLGAGVKTLDGPGGDTGILFSASVPLPLFNRNQGTYMRRAADARRATAEYTLARERIAADVAVLANRADALREAALAYENDASGSAAELGRITRVAYDAGEIGVMEAIDALRAAYETELGLIGLRRDARAAFIALQELSPDIEE